MLEINDLRVLSEGAQDRVMCALTPIEYMYTRLVLSGSLSNFQIKSICKMDNVKEEEIKNSVTSKINNMMDLMKTIISNKLVSKFGDKETLEAELIGLTPITQYIIIHYYGIDTECKSLQDIAKDLKLPFRTILTHYNNGLRELNRYIN